MVEKIIDKFKRFIKYKGWTYSIAAQQLGCDRTHLGRIFNKRRNPSAALITKMEELMNRCHFEEE